MFLALLHGSILCQKTEEKKTKKEKFKYSYSFFSAIFDYHSILRKNIRPCLVIRQRRGQEAEDVAEHQRVQLSRPGAEEEERTLQPLTQSPAAALDLRVDVIQGL